MFYPGYQQLFENDCVKRKIIRGKCTIKNANLNISSLKNREHIILAKETAICKKIDIFTISESWLDSSVSEADVEFPGYILRRLDRVKKHGGGVCAFVRREYRSEQSSNISFISDSGSHQLWLKIHVQNFNSFLVCTAYRRSNTRLDCFDSDFSNTLHVVWALSLSLPFYILGDLNCNLQDPAAQSLVNVCSFSIIYNKLIVAQGGLQGQQNH